MSWDLAFWRRSDTDADPSETWDALNAEEDVPEGVDAVSSDALSAFFRTTGAAESEAGALRVFAGHGWETGFEADGEVSHVVVSWAWSVHDDEDAWDALTSLVEALCQTVDLYCFDPQAEDEFGA